MFSKFWRLFLSSLLVVVLLNTWSEVQAEPTEPISPISLEFNTIEDGRSYVPDGSPINKSPTRGIIGSDNRVPMDVDEYPWSTIGRLYWVLEDGQEIGWCTATLVGEDVVLTNSHCLEHPITEQIVDPETYSSGQDRLVFVRHMYQGRLDLEEDVALVTEDYRYGWQTAPEDIREDWALLKINKPLGADVGYLGWRDLDFTNDAVINAAQGKLNLAGYSGDYPDEVVRTARDLDGAAGETAGVHLQCSISGDISGDFDGVILHDCDTMGGASGSALIALFDDDQFYILGLHRGWFGFQEDDISSLPPEWQETCQGYNRTGEIETVPACRNVAVPVSRWATQAADMRTES
jgi:protease YdgD